ncbi:hypothetical protein [Antrihabitans sp. YC2-6]|uniref:hypothetical protein n=1 Tax=Antrihabitans sp. YC2-6 TaxID=2799498 RepID=UPI0018F6519B|nr:hypothetical protein [Antrihabitans sp. YC2-6]MBJ8347162.1 hypothetical protein [Antrihabitans sp. YC2-6]
MRKTVTAKRDNGYIGDRPERVGHEAVAAPATRRMLRQTPGQQLDVGEGTPQITGRLRNR